MICNGKECVNPEFRESSRREYFGATQIPFQNNVEYASVAYVPKSELDLFSCFYRTLACNKQTHTNGHRAIAYTKLT